MRSIPYLLPAQRTRKGLERIKVLGDFPKGHGYLMIGFSLNRFYVQGHPQRNRSSGGIRICHKTYLSSTPRPWEVTKRLAAYQRHGRLYPCVVLTQLPPLREAVAGQEYHCPQCLSSPRRVLPGGDSSLLVAPYSIVHPGADGKVAHAHRNGNGNVSGEWV